VLSYLAIGSLAPFLVLTLALAGARSRVADVARSNWRLVLPVAVLVPLNYGLVLTAMQHLDVQVVAAARSTASSPPRSSAGGCSTSLVHRGG
jgi:hypothetical protein